MAYHLCTSGGSQDPCFTAIEGKAWKRLMDEAGEEWCVGQRWYCNRCTARYKPGMGMLCEIRVSTGDVFWLRSTYPAELNDVKHMRIEEDMAGVTSPGELFSKIQAVSPYLGDSFLRPCAQAEIWKGSKEGVYAVVNKPLLSSMPIFKFEDIISFTKLE